jgi:hypothetical protein
MIMNRLMAFVVVLFLAGCGPAQYAVKESTDKFSDPQQPAMYSMEGNVLETDPAGIATYGYLDAFVSRDRERGRVVLVGLEYTRVTNSGELTWSGEPKWLAIRAGDELVVLADDERIVVKASGGSIDHQVERTGAGPSTTFYDVGRYPLTSSQLLKIATAARVEFKFSGREGSRAVPRSGTKLGANLQANLRRFYDEQVAPFMQ